MSRIGFHHSDESRAKMSLSHTGKHVSLETREKMSLVHSSHPNKGTFKKGHVTWNKGKVGLRNEKHGMWKGDKAGYRSIHLWVISRLGKPKICEHCGDTKLRNRQYNWANVSGKYKRVFSDWKRLCVKCHREYDKNKPRSTNEIRITPKITPRREKG